MVMCIPALSVLAEEVVMPEQPPVEVPESQASAPSGNVSEAQPSEQASAELPSEQPIQPPNKPVKHLVQRGDTLWSISTAYLTDPFYWPKVWDVNRFIKNPDRIYPGAVIMLPSPEDLQKTVKVEVPAEPMPPEPAPVDAIPAEELEEEPVAKAPEATLPPPTPQPTVTEPAVEQPLDQVLVASVGFLLSGDVGSSGVLIGAKDQRVLVGERDIVYLKNGNKLSSKEGDQLLVYRSIRKVYHPRTGKYMGKLVMVLGTLKVVEVGSKIVTARVVKSYNYILSGDRVAPYEAIRLPSFVKNSSGEENQVQGFVVDVKEEKVAIGQFDVVYIDRGMRDGIGRGSSFKVIRDGERTPYFSVGAGVLLPPRTIGELEVISANDHTATAMVRKSSETISRGDRIEALTPPQ
jgi:LysM repeat protein